MSQNTWKDILLKNRDLCNHLVLTEKKTNSNFSEESLSENLVPFFNALLSQKEGVSPEEQILSLFQILLTLISKNFFKQSPPVPQLFLETISGLSIITGENLNENLSYLSNVLVKIEETKKELFIKRIQSLSKSISSTEEWKALLTIFFWASGKPEYRIEAEKQFRSLPQKVKNEIQTLIGITEDTLAYAFPKRINPPKETDPVHFRVIPGYTLFGGLFQNLPILHLGKETNFNSVIVSSGLSTFSLYLDQFGTNLISRRESTLSEKPNTSIHSSFWKLIVSKKLELKGILSVVESETFILLTLQNSYHIYLFYLGS
ncbi:hypothetical protein [Leptospira brenneri]|uniref:hypothetical protein n=1 Tax=Leptospira brenneri TaxID=2023182 RepID=UPI000C2A65F4|nr:hypothetical protein [Leptospira brenneri]PJZ44490.1 hypothetical protein CH361_15420 [Leptospira brenneri]